MRKYLAYFKGFITLHMTVKTNRRVLKNSVYITAAIIFILLAVFSGMLLIKEAFSVQQDGLMPVQPVVTSSLPGFFRPEIGLARGKFLIASRHLKDPYFSETVILLIKYDLTGAMGLVINQPTDVKLSTILPEIEGLQQRKDTVYIGGPVGRRQMLLLMQSGNQIEDSYRVFDDVYVSSNREVLRQIIDDTGGGKRFRIYAGYAGWVPGQLEQEISKGSWHILSANADTIFDKTPSKIWQELIRRTSVLQVGLNIFLTQVMLSDQDMKRN